MHWQAISGLLAASLAAAAASSDVTSNSIPRHLAPATCSSQPGVDFVGKDLANVGGASSACCAKCQDTPGCKAYTWTDFNGGTCWLKSGVTQVQSYAGAVSGTVDPRTEENTDYVGNDVGSAPGAKAPDCVAKCKAFTGCGAYTWSDWNGGTCWLKSGRGEVRAAAGVHSAEVSDDQSKWTIEQGKDYEGYDLTNKPGKEAAQCTTLCEATSGCRAFTWSDWNGGTCWLKSARGTTTSKEGAVSGSKEDTTTLPPVTTAPPPVTTAPPPVTTAPPPVTTAAPPTGQCELTDGVDIVGNDIGAVRTPVATDCCAICAMKPGCAAYTWSSWDGGACWLKSAVGEVRPSANAISGRVRADASKPHIQYALRNGSIPSRSVNLGGWLVSEYWMSKRAPQWKGVPSAEPYEGERFNARYHAAWGGEYITMKYWNDRGERERGVRQFEEHRATWITENDIREIRDAGLNSVRVPVGFWIADEIDGLDSSEISRVYAPGSLKYLDKLINNWAVKYNVAVMVSLHAHQGSQNGDDHSAPQEMGNVGWSKDQSNLRSSQRFARKLAERYKHSPAFLGLGLMNEPTDVNYDWVKEYYWGSYAWIRSTGNDCVLTVSPRRSEQNQSANRDLMTAAFAYKNVWTEWHSYYTSGYEGQNASQILDAVRKYPETHFADWPGNPVFMGEWSLGSPAEGLKDRDFLKQFATLQLESFQGAKAGWSFRSWHHDETNVAGVVSAWSLRQLLRLGIVTVPK